MAQNAIIAKLKKAGVNTESNGIISVNLQMYDKFIGQEEKKTHSKVFSNAYTSNVTEQVIREKELLREFQTCQGTGVPDRDWINSNLGSIDMKKLEQLLTGDFFDDATMNAMICISNAAYFANTSSLAANDRIRSWIHNLKIVGDTNSLSGFAMLGNAGDATTSKSTAKGAFIIKAVKNNERGDELIHEAFCAMFALNKIRHDVPNFAFVYGYLTCSPPVQGVATPADPKGKEINTFCNTMGLGNDVVQAIYENVSPAKDFADVCKVCDGEMFMQYYMATMFALLKAEKEYDFTHYDLHSGNVLIRECTDQRYVENGKGIFYVPYTVKIDTKVYTFYVVSQGGIPTIIDYGRSHVNVDGRNYGMPGSDSYHFV